jgi:hypothetical protein
MGPPVVLPRAYVALSRKSGGVVLHLSSCAVVDVASAFSLVASPSSTSSLTSDVRLVCATGSSAVASRLRSSAVMYVY